MPGSHSSTSIVVLCYYPSSIWSACYINWKLRIHSLIKLAIYCRKNMYLELVRHLVALYGSQALRHCHCGSSHSRSLFSRTAYHKQEIYLLGDDLRMFSYIMLMLADNRMGFFRVWIVPLRKVKSVAFSMAKCRRVSHFNCYRCLNRN